MKRYRTATMILLFIAAAALLVCAIVPALKRTAVPAQASLEQTYKEDYSSKSAASQEIRERAAQSASEAEVGYLVREYQGKIGIFQNGESLPVRTAEVDVSQLPEEDQQLLRQGIPAETLGEARRILEDYQ